jgi:hypothetical protein
MKRLLLIPAALVLLVACESDAERKEREKVEDCYAKGGEPEFTVDREGNVQHFFLCELP